MNEKDLGLVGMPAPLLYNNHFQVTTYVTVQVNLDDIILLLITTS